jgi:hypothetical protein
MGEEELKTETLGDSDPKSDTAESGEAERLPVGSKLVLGSVVREALRDGSVGMEEAEPDSVAL